MAHLTHGHAADLADACAAIGRATAHADLLAYVSGADELRQQITDDVTAAADRAAIAYLRAKDDRDRRSFDGGEQAIAEWNDLLRLREWLTNPGKPYPSAAGGWQPSGVAYLRWDAEGVIDARASRAFMPTPPDEGQYTRWQALARHSGAAEVEPPRRRLFQARCPP